MRLQREPRRCDGVALENILDLGRESVNSPRF